ncbi:MAG: pH regulation protein F [Syntrophomonadaceae bacterium]|jgi:multicomponent Na+:H+ antiporter subunit F|nr:pH regulation protein F [Syntrophomonadaceae bacterium]
MGDFFLAIAVIIGILVILSLYRVVYGPGVWNRLAGVNIIGTKTIVILALVGFIFDRVDMFVDIALIYAMLNFVVVLIIARYYTKEEGEG